MNWRKYFRTYYRIRLKTKNERTQYYKEPQLVRPKRRPHNLPTSWDDLPRTLIKNWKFKSKKRRQHGYDQKRIVKFKRGASDDAPLLFELIP